MLIPSSGQYIDFHTHHNWNYPHIFSIRSLVKPGEWELASNPGKAIAFGIHPWYIRKETFREELEKVREASVLAQVIAIGECGIDLKIETPYNFQENVFLQQAGIASEIGKPLIIHCVRAYQQLTNLLKTQKPSVPWIFHGFNHNEQLAKELIKHGAYLSIGGDLLKENSKIRKAIRDLPLDRIFFETDEWQQPVWKLYAEASKLLSVPDKVLKEATFENFRRCFGFAG